jgi:hypothetical protein
MSALDSTLRGVAASALGTLAMDALLYRRYRHGGGTAAFPGWESSVGLASWENAPAPALVAKRFLEEVLQHDVSPRYARLLNNATHWGFGLATGAGYGLLLGSRHTPKVWYGLRSALRSGPAATSCSHYSAPTSRSGSTGSKRSGKT